MQLGWREVDPMNLLAWALAAVHLLPVYHEDRNEPHKASQLALIASAVAEAARNKEEAALLLTIASHETNLSYRIHTNRCRPLECDRGRARGYGRRTSIRALARSGFRLRA